MTENQKPKTMFWVIGIIMLIWYALGCFAYLLTSFITPEMLAELPDDQRSLMENIPAWVTAAFGIAVWIGLLASIIMLIRRKVAYQLYILSFLGVIVQMYYVFFMTNAMSIYETGDKVRTVLVIVIGAYMIYYTKMAKGKGWLK